MSSPKTFLESVNDGLEKFNRNMQRRHLVQGAISDLKRNTHTERATIETALRMAKSGVELEEKLRDPRFSEAYEQASKILSSLPDAPKLEPESIYNPVPMFERRDRHGDPLVEEGIQRNVEELRADREAFLSTVRTQLAGDPVLRGHFLKNLQKLHGCRYLAGLDPTSSWNRL